MADSGSTSQGVLDLLRYLQYASSFPDFPKGNASSLPLEGAGYRLPNRDHGLLIFNYFALFGSTAAVALRLRLRARASSTFGIDDWLIVPALIFTLIFIIIEIVLIQRFHVGRHVYDIPFSSFRTALHLEFVGVLTYYCSVLFTKMSIVAFLYRLFGKTSTSLRRLLHCTAVFYVLLFAASMLTYSLACAPVSASWDILVKVAPTSRCVDILAMITTFGVIYAVGDCWLLFLPLPAIWRLQLPLWSRLGLIIVLSFGVVACVGAILKVVFIRSLYDTWDPTWKSSPTLWGAVLEVSAGIISASLPALSGFMITSVPAKLRNWLGSSFFSRKSRGKSSEQNAGGKPLEEYTTQSGNDTKSSKKKTFNKSIQVITTMETTVTAPSVRSVSPSRMSQTSRASSNFLGPTINCAIREQRRDVGLIGVAYSASATRDNGESPPTSIPAGVSNYITVDQDNHHGNPATSSPAIHSPTLPSSPRFHLPRHFGGRQSGSTSDSPPKYSIAAPTQSRAKHIPIRTNAPFSLFSSHPGSESPV